MRAVLVFCEGKHDVIFVERSLGACANCERLEQPIWDLPSPFGAGPGRSRGLITQRLTEVTVEDLCLQDSYPPTPQFESLVKRSEQDVFVLIRAGGKDGAEAVLKLIQQTDKVMSFNLFAVTEYAAAFLFDANDMGLNATIAAFRNAYAPHYGNLDGIAHARWSGTSTTPVGLYVFHAEGKETGTLEDHTAPMVAAQWPERYDAASRFIDSKPGCAVLGNEARRLKAVMTATGQFDHPGRPLGTILARNGLSVERYRTCSAANDLASFLLATPWQSSAGTGSRASGAGGQR